MLFEQFMRALWILIPAYVANGTPPVIRKGHPMDFGKTLRGHRILGDGKTWEGFSVGMIASMIIGTIELYFFPQSNLTRLLIILIPLGTLVGDMIGSFIKRQMGMKRGKKAPVLDQLDFIFGVLLFTFAFVDYTIWMILIMIALTYFAHRGTCILGYKLGIKKEPW